MTDNRPFSGEFSSSGSDDDSENDLLAEKSSHSLEIFVRLENTTAHTEISDERKLHVQQLLEKGLVLDLPEKTCASGHNLALNLWVAGSSPELKIRFTAKVEKVRNWPADHVDEATLRLLQYPENTWNALHKIFNQRQKQIMEFLTASGGKD